MTETPPVFTSYRLPLSRRRQGPAAVLSLLAHAAIAAAVLWRGAALLEPGAGGPGPRGGGGGARGGQPAVNWFTLPAPSAPQALEVPPAPAVTVPAALLPDPVAIDVPLLPLAAPVTAPAPAASGAAGQGPGTGGGQGRGTGTGTGADVGPGSGGEGGYIFPAYAWGVIVPPDCARGEFLVRFWVEIDGRVSRVDVSPPPKDAGCRRHMTELMKAYRFRPARTREGQPVASIYQIRLIH